MVVLPPTITNRGRLAATPLAAASAPRSLATHRFTLHRAQPDPGTEKGGTHPHKPTYTHTHTHTHTQRGEESDRISNRGLEKRMEREREVEYLQASLQAADCLRRERRSVFRGRPFQPICAAPVRSILDPRVCRALNSPSPLRSHSVLLRRDHTYVTLAGSMFSRAMTPVAVTSKVPSPPSTCTRNTRPNSSNNEQLRPSREANSKQRQATAMTTPPQAACPSSRPSVQLSATPCALARPPRRGL
jgi:hypothetical protein